MRKSRKEKKRQAAQQAQKKVKMRWTACKIIFRVISPIHIGLEKKSNLQTTRCYVTGRNFWGALTARIARENGERKYSEIGKNVDENLAFTYFYISDHEGNWVNPWDEKGQVSDEFSWKYLGSYMSTSINKRNADEGSLHEVEFISPYTKDGEKVFLTGYVFEKMGANDDFKANWKEALKKLSFGGERSYGWGQVEYVSMISLPTNNLEIQLCINRKIIVHLDKDRPCLECQDGDILTANIRTEDENDKSTFIREGSLVPFAGRLTKDDNNKRIINQIDNSGICWTPGSKIKSSNDGLKFKIIEKGLWKKETD